MSEICGDEFEIPSFEIMGDWPARVVQEIPETILKCTRPPHADNQHTDGQSVWRSEP